jgi:heptose I phosphotransferase
MALREEILPNWRERLRGAGLETLAPLLAADGRPALAGDWHDLHKPGLGGRRRWRWVLPDAPSGIAADRDELFIKRYEQTPPTAQLDRLRRQTARHSRAWWEYAISQQLAAAHIPAARAVGFIEEMAGPIERRSVVLFERVAGDAFDRAWAAAQRRGAVVTRGVARHDVAVRLARFVAAFHQTGCCHRDLYLCHIFVQLDESARRPPAFCLIDLARIHRPRLRRMRWILKDLAQLDASARQIGASRSDRLRWLLAYLGLTAESPRVRWYARQITRRSNAILEREARKGRLPVKR